MRLITWLLRAFLFFVLFAFALNNQHEARLKWFFGYEWRAPMVIIVLGAFALGCALGLLGHLPGWVRRVRQSSSARDPAIGPAQSAAEGRDGVSSPGASTAVTARREAGRGSAAPAPGPGPDMLIEPPRDAL